MKNLIPVLKRYHLPAIALLSAINLLAVAGCSSIGGTARNQQVSKYIERQQENSSNQAADSDPGHENIRKADDYWVPPGRAAGQPYDMYGPR